jgi:hypothetical protein
MRKIDLPRISERIRGFTLTEDGIMYVFDYDEVFRVSLEGAPSIEVLPDNPYEFEASRPDSFGVSERDPILSFGHVSLKYNFDPSANSQCITVTANGTVETIEFRTLSGDWFAATLSAEGKYLVGAEPYLIEVWSLK